MPAFEQVKSSLYTRTSKAIKELVKENVVVCVCGFILKWKEICNPNCLQLMTNVTSFICPLRADEEKRQWKHDPILTFT